jgi:hypothetical protein
MKIKPPQILGGIAALAFILSNIFYVINWIVKGYGTPNWSLGFWTWPMDFVVKLAAILIFILIFNNNLVRYMVAGIYLLFRLIYSLYWMNSSEESIGYFAKLFIDFPYWGSFDLAFIAAMFGLLSFALFTIAVILSFRHLPQSGTLAPEYSENISKPISTRIPPTEPKKAQSGYGDIEILGDLLKKGLLTQREFELKKREILGLNEKSN